MTLVRNDTGTVAGPNGADAARGVGPAGGAAVRRLPPRGGYGLDKIEAVRRLVVDTDLPITEIAEQAGIAASTVRNWIQRYGWPRPASAPPLTAPRDPFDPAVRRARLTVRLYRAVGRELKRLERRTRAKNEQLAEKDARTLGILAKTLATLTELDRDDGAKVREPETVDRDQIDADLAERIARWAEGGERA